MNCYFQCTQNSRSVRLKALLVPWETTPIPTHLLEAVLAPHAFNWSMGMGSCKAIQTTPVSQSWAGKRGMIIDQSCFLQQSPLKLTAHHANTETLEPPGLNLSKACSSAFLQFSEPSMSSQYIPCLLNVSEHMFHVYNPVTLTTIPGHLWLLKLPWPAEWAQKSWSAACQAVC